MIYLQTAKYVVKTGQATMVDPKSGRLLGKIPDEIYDQCELCEPDRFDPCPHCGTPPVPKGKGVILDTFTASMLAQVIEKLSLENRRRLAELPFVTAINICWKCCRS